MAMVTPSLGMCTLTRWPAAPADGVRQEPKLQACQLRTPVLIDHVSALLCCQPADNRVTFDKRQGAVPLTTADTLHLSQ